MENKVFEKNIAHIEAYDKDLYNQLLMFNDEKSNVQLIQDNSSQYNLLFNDVILHDEIDALSEVKNIYSNLEDKNSSNIIRVIYGLGLGYLPDEFSKNIKNSKIIIYEPNLDIIHLVLSIAQIDALYQENVILCQNKEQLKKYIKNFSNKDTNITISFLNSYKKLFSEDIKEVLNVIERAQGEEVATDNTAYLKANLIFSNMFNNLKNIIHNADISVLKDIYKDKTAIILCAGPSLEKNIDVILKNQDKFVIFALNPTLQLLKEKGLKPDFILDIEASENSNQFKNIDLSETYLILESYCSCEVSKLKSKKNFNYISMGNALNDWIRDVLDIKENIKSIGSVSYTALNTCLLMGFKKIIFVGQDLAYSDGKCYAKGSQFEDMECVFDEKEQKYKIVAKDMKSLISHIKTDKITEQTTFELADVMIQMYNKNLYTVKSQDGKLIPTKTTYALFIDYFEEFAKEIKEKYPHVELINSSTGGALINGYENISLDEVVKTLDTVKKLDLSKYQSKYDMKKVENEISKLTDNILDMSNYSRELLEINKKIIKEIELKKVYTDNLVRYIKKHIEKLKELDKLNKNKYSDILLKFYFSKIIELIKTDYISDIEKLRETLNKINLQIYALWSIINPNHASLVDCKSFILE